MKKLFLLTFVAFTFACAPQEKKDLESKEAAIQEIYEMEKSFNEMLAKEGRAAAFAHFAAENGGLQRGGRMVIGKDSIFAFYDRSTTTNVKLTWVPDRVDISDDLTMASTWGKFEFSGTRENGEAFNSIGIFHTVWKKQADGNWRYVYD